VTKGLLVRLEAKPSEEDEVERFLTDARPLVERESETTAWFAVRFGRSEYGIFDVFPDEQGRDAHLQGAVAAGLSQRGDELFAEAPRIERVDVLADKLPSRPPATEIQKGLLLTFAPKSEHEDDVANFLRGGRDLVEDEPGTLAWFAIKLEDGRYGIFDVFPETERGSPTSPDAFRASSRSTRYRCWAPSRPKRTAHPLARKRRGSRGR